jgi:hypothetical protein
MTLKEKILDQVQEMPLEVNPTQKDIDNYNLSISNLNKIAEDFAIGFAEFCSKYHDKNRNIYGEMLHAKSKYDDTYTIKELLEIYKKEKGL